MGNQNEITLETHGTVTLLDIKGDVTTYSDPFLKDAYAVLIQLLAETKSNNQQIGITGLSEHFNKIFNMVGITKFAKIYSNVEEALQGLAG
jgi:anti-anti-sigma regulatory factor